MARAAELPPSDLDHVLEQCRDSWSEFHNARLFITGAGGFVGSWMLESLLHAQRRLRFGINVTALVRDPGAFVKRYPHLVGRRSLALRAGDVRTADVTTGTFTHFVHCASAASPATNAERPGEVVAMIEDGSARMIDAAARNPGTRFLQMSSGSVYGAVPADMARIPESYAGVARPDVAAERFGAAKLAAERRGEAAAEKGLHFVAARGFAIVGPRIPLDGQFAIGNFFGDALAGCPVEVRGDGAPVRSWMHAADFAAWSWTILATGRRGIAYNVGSDEAHSIGDAAAQVAALADPPVPVVRRQEPVPGATPLRFVPDVTRARSELGLDVRIPFSDALQRTWSWLRQ